MLRSRSLFVYGGASFDQRILNVSCTRTAGSFGLEERRVWRYFFILLVFFKSQVGALRGTIWRGEQRQDRLKWSAFHKLGFLAQHGVPHLWAGTFPTPPHKIAHRGDKRATAVKSPLSSAHLFVGCQSWGSFPFPCLDLPGSGQRPECLRRIAGGYAALRQSILRILCSAASGGAHSLRCSSSPQRNRFAGFRRGPKQIGIALRQRHSISKFGVDSQRGWTELSDQIYVGQIALLFVYCNP